MFFVSGNSVYLAHKEEVLWPETKNMLQTHKLLLAMSRLTSPPNTS